SEPGGSGRLGRTLDEALRDISLAGRTLRRAPGFAFVTIVTLALAIGANTAIFSVVDTVLLDPLDYPASDRLVAIYSSAPGSDLPDEFGPAPEFYLQYQDAELLDGVGIFRQSQTTARWADQIDRLFVTQASPSVFTTLGATPALGRLPTPEDDPGSIAVISHGLWETWFGSDPEVIGHSFEVSGRMRTIVGVMKPDFRFPEQRVTVWIHQELTDEAELRPGDFGGSYLLARLAPAAELSAVEAELTLLASRLPDRFGGSQPYRDIIEKHRPVIRSLETQLVGDVAGPLWLLLGTVAIVLLIACTNVANLFSVRAESRRRDFDVRQALGAGRGRLVRSQMTEAVVLAALGGAAGVLIAWVSLPLLVRFAPENIPNLDTARLDGTALLFSSGLALLTAFVFGLAPSIRFSRPRVVGALGQRGGVGERRRGWGRDALVLVQTASALVLLVGSGLLMRSFLALTSVDPGYDTRDIFSFQVAPQRDELVDGPSYAQFHQGFMERVAALPGVDAVGLTNWLPLDEGAGQRSFTTEQSQVSGDRLPPVRLTMVGGEFFAAMGIALERGRTFDSSDHQVGSGTAIVGARTARQLWPGEDPLGQRLSHDDGRNWATVVGVVEDIFVEDFRAPERDPMVYLPMVGPDARSWGVGSPAYVVRTERADVIAPDIRALMREHVPESPMYRIFTMEALAQRSMAQLSFTMLMLAIASGLALVLGAVGLYGVLSYVVSTRNREIAVRMAVGARDRTVRRMVVLQGARLTALGVLAGLVAALFLTRALESLLFGVGSMDATTFAAMSGLMLLVALLASYLPARRASLVDPMEALRSE
ncbi:MAG: ABC transporter permease, partial [Gemmatimonadetes bacterium]|nr:ABC transporter permease [Gemmatimonadota bacterium]